mmetsp:Transcript_19436/g.37435  ORF Transcript_19436/g.37435 Transcript_19436/m.37435 type:complete len:686 (+) Transcript_19436:82-2139(+)
MAVRCLTIVAMTVSTFQEAYAGNTSPISKVIDMLSSLKSKIEIEGKEAQRLFEETTSMCSSRSKQLEYEIKTGGSDKTELEASIADDTAKLMALEDKMEELAASIASDEADLKSATEIRKRDAADFAAQEKELLEVVSTIERAIGILERETRKNSASLLQQTKDVTSVTQALNVLVDATGISTTEGRRLTALVQNFQETQNDDGENAPGAPDPAAYEGKSGDIITTLENLQTKAEAKLSELRTAETSARHNYELMKQSLSDEISLANKEMDAARKNKAETNERQATAEGELQTTKQDLDSDIEAFRDLKQTCGAKDEDFEAGVKSRAEEIKVLAQAMSVMSKMVTGANSVAYGLNQVSLLQNSIVSRTDLANFEAVRFVRDLARKVNAPALAQLAFRMASAIRSSNTQDPFGKVRGLITDMIAKLQAEAEAEAKFKEHCDKELADTKTKKIEKSTEVDYLNTKIDQMSSRAAKLKNEVAALQNAVAEIVGMQGEIDNLRKEENDEFKRNKVELDQGLEGVKLAIKMLQDYYAKDGTQGHESEASNILGLLEVIESDLSKGITDAMTTEDAATAAHYLQTMQNKVEKKMKEQDIKYKVKEAAELDKQVAETKSDLEGVQNELSAVLSYLGMLQKQCIAKAESYAERSARRQAEIAGLREALKILEEETALLQRNAHGRKLRGAGKK